MKFNRAAIIIPPIRDFYFTRHRFSALGAHIVEKILLSAGLHTELLNFPLMNIRGAPLPLPGALNHLEPYLIANETGKLSFFTELRRFGPSADQCVSMIGKANPDICFFSVFAFCYADDAIDLACAVKKNMPGVPVVMGGAGPSAYPEYFLRNFSIDYVLAGEAEASLEKFLQRINRDTPDFPVVPNLWWKIQDKIQRHLVTGAAKSDRIIVPLEKSARTSKTVTFSTSLSRGCPKRCAFCSSRFAHGAEFRTAPEGSISRALKELGPELVPKNKQVIINFEDDNLLADEPFLKSAVSLFRKRIPGVQFVAENGIDHSFLSPELCGWLIDNGMKKFNLSLGSIDPGILARGRRFIDLERYEQVIRLLERNQVPNVTYFICGFKEDTLETTLNNLVYLHKLPTLIGISPYYAVPGLSGFENRSVFDCLPSSLCLGAAIFPWNNSLSTKIMITAFRLARFSNLLKSHRQSDMEKEMLDLIADKKSLYTTIKEKNGKERVIEVPNQDKDLVQLFFRKINDF